VIDVKSNNMTKQDKILRSKLGLLKLVQELGNVSRACELMGYSRDSYYRLKELYDKGGTLALQEKSRRKPNLKNRVDESVESSIIDMAYQQPFYGQSKAAEELKKQGVFVSPAGVRSVWQRYDLENFQKRLKALGTKMLQEGYHPNEWQVKALEQAQLEYQNNNPMDTYFPGHLLFQTVEEVVSHKTLGTLYQYIMLDTYTRVAFVLLCNNSSTDCAITALREKTFPFFEGKSLKIYRLATTKEECFYGKSSNHKFRKCLIEEGIELSYLPKSSHLLKPLRDFIQHINNNFYTESFRNKTYTSTAAIQADLDNWVANYNKSEVIYERYNYGKSPLDTFKAILPFTRSLQNQNVKAQLNGLSKYIHLLKPLVIPMEL
jgi:Winged helix-turn helix